MTHTQFYEAIKNGTIKAGNYTMPDGSPVEVFHDGEGWVRREFCLNREESESDKIARQAEADPTFRCFIIAKFRTAGTVNDCYYHFFTKGGLDNFQKKHPELIQLDVFYHPENYMTN